MLRKIVFWGMMISCILGITMAGPAQAAIIPNGNFEMGNFSYWNWTGNVGLDTPPNNINGNYSAYLWSSGVNDVCSWLWSDDIYPTYVPKSITVKFKVRYLTDEPIYPTQVDDPFHAMLKFDDGNGDVTMVTISSNAVSPGPGFSVQDLTTGAILPSRAMPSFSDVVLGWDWISNVMLVSGTIPYSGCAPVNIRFDICNALDDTVPSLGQVDDVDITFVNAPGATGTWWKTPGAPVLCP